MEQKFFNQPKSLNDIITSATCFKEINIAMQNGYKPNEYSLSKLYSEYTGNLGRIGKTGESYEQFETAKLIIRNGGTFDEYTRNVLSQPYHKLTKLQIDKLENLANKNNLEKMDIDKFSKSFNF